MKLRLANATIFDSTSKFHLQKTNLLIEDGIITKIGDFSEGKSIDLKGKYLSPGWVDMSANFSEPGLEHKEDTISGSNCAVKGGFTDVCLVPNTYPPIESKGDVQFVLAQSKAVSLWPLAALSEGLKGENLTEILDLHKHGAVGFTDGLNPIWNSELLLKALQYMHKFDGLVIDRPKDLALSKYMQMHEGVMSTSLGLNGEPSLSEELMILRDIEILRYAGGRIHFSNISTKKSVDLIKRAKKIGLRVTCDVAINNLIFTDDDLETFDTNYKVDPPFRTERDRKALIRGLNEGVIDAIASAHQPQDQECKDLEFDLADFGTISLQTVFSSLVSIKEELPLEVSFQKLTTGPRGILGFDKISIAEGGVAKLAIFDLEAEWTFDNKTNQSKSINSPYFGKKLKGKAIGIINKRIVSLEGY
ncbi:MAG: dihydroorotase [Cyclobacteriaceae bacterium]|jgi:dihydroorotase